MFILVVCTLIAQLVFISGIAGIDFDGAFTGQMVFESGNDQQLMGDQKDQLDTSSMKMVSELFIGDVSFDDDTRPSGIQSVAAWRQLDSNDQLYAQNRMLLSFVDDSIEKVNGIKVSRSTKEDGFGASNQINRDNYTHNLTQASENVQEEYFNEMRMWQSMDGNIKVSSIQNGDVRLPNVTDKQTIVGLGMIAANAYIPPDGDGWRQIPGVDRNSSFGWDNSSAFIFSDNDQDGQSTASSHNLDGNNLKPQTVVVRFGLRGHVFTSEDQSLVIIVFKGTTSLGYNWDRKNDNMMFSCCCGRLDPFRPPTCDCYRGRSLGGSFQPKCSLQCFEQHSRNYTHSYYDAAKQIYAAVRSQYPKSQIWFVGHSLAGALASVMSLTTQDPAVTFQAPGERQFAERLGLLDNVDHLKELHPEDDQIYRLKVPIYHIGNNADVIYLGKCTGIGSVCFYGGYAIETKCHVGNVCNYKIDRSPDVFYHKMATVLKEIIGPQRDVPPFIPAYHHHHHVVDDIYDDGQKSSGNKQSKKKNSPKSDLVCSDCANWRYV
ncbi:hypothetical protein MIR68_007353 [Amoeboaphelidium protococcarum]|nr:hypothetical protein MIR68_007353 [Amoeboaphelidium protococcarum]